MHKPTLVRQEERPFSMTCMYTITTQHEQSMDTNIQNSFIFLYGIHAIPLILVKWKQFTYDYNSRNKIHEILSNTIKYIVIDYFIQWTMHYS